MTKWTRATSGEQHDVWDREKQKTIEGLLIEKRTNVGPKDSNLYVIEEAKTNEKKSVWGTALLNNIMNKMPVGTLVKITYKGKAKGKNNDYHDFDVDYEKETMPDQTAEDIFDSAGQ